MKIFSTRLSLSVWNTYLRLPLTLTFSFEIRTGGHILFCFCQENYLVFCILVVPEVYLLPAGLK